MRNTRGITKERGGVRKQMYEIHHSTFNLKRSFPLQTVQHFTINDHVQVYSGQNIHVFLFVNSIRDEFINKYKLV
jgi:hypothetical protein